MILNAEDADDAIDEFLRRTETTGRRHYYPIRADEVSGQALDGVDRLKLLALHRPDELQ